MADCELLDRCGFFRKYEASLHLACRGFVKSYCRGPLMVECKRKDYRKAHNTAPPDDMLPTGQMLPKEYQDAV